MLLVSFLVFQRGWLCFIDLEERGAHLQELQQVPFLQFVVVVKGRLPVILVIARIMAKVIVGIVKVIVEIVIVVRGVIGIIDFD